MCRNIYGFAFRYLAQPSSLLSLTGLDFVFALPLGALLSFIFHVGIAHF